MDHSPKFLEIVNDSKSRIKELTINDVKTMFDSDEEFHFIDVREESEWAAKRIPGAIHLGRGILERDIENMIPNPEEKIVLYCGGGFRSALSAENLIKMGYADVYSMDGGIRGWEEAGLPLERD